MQRPQLTLKILFFAGLDVAGMVVFATGALWLARGQELFVRGFPTSTAEALLLLVGGLLLMVWAVAKILRELIKPAPAPTGDDN